MGGTIKSFKKKKSFKKAGIIEIDEEFSLPLRTLSRQDSRKEYIKNINKVYKTRRMNKEEVEEYMKDHPNENLNVVKKLLTLELDLGDENYLESTKENKELEEMVSMVKYVDLSYKLEDGSKLWEDLELESVDDYIGLAKKLFYKEEDGGLELGESFAQTLMIHIRALESDPIMTKFLKMHNLHGKQGDEFDMLEDLLNAEQYKERMEELTLRVAELEDKLKGADKDEESAIEE